MGKNAIRLRKLTGREEMPSPGGPVLRGELERRFWEQIATGITSESAAAAVGVSRAQPKTGMQQLNNIRRRLRL